MFELLVILWTYQPHAGVSRTPPGELELADRRGGMGTSGFPQGA